MKNTLKLIINFILILALFLSQPLKAEANLSSYKLNNNSIKFVNSLGNAFNTNTGFLNQPYYYSADRWWQLTFSTMPLDYAVGVDGDGSSNENTLGTILDNPALTNVTIDSSNFTQSGELGYGVLVVSGTISIAGKSVGIQYTYELPQNSNYIKIKVRFSNPINASSSITNLRYWVGTGDDYVGPADTNLKEKGNISNQGFVKISSASTPANALKISTTGHNVLFFTESTNTNMIISQSRGFTSVRSILPSTSLTSLTGDNAYGLYARLNDLSPGQSQEVVWYYAAGNDTEIGSIVSDLASASGGGFENITYSSADTKYSSSQNGTGYFIVLPSTQAAPTKEQIKLANVSGIVTLGSKSMTANTQTTFNISGLTQNSTYKFWFTIDNGTTLTEPISGTFTTLAFQLPTLASTSAAASIGNTSAIVEGNVTSDGSDGGAPITERGICYATTSNPTTANTCVTSGTGLGSFTASLINLTPNTTYYARAYAINSVGTSYGTQISFKTLSTISTSLTGLANPRPGASQVTSFSGTGYTATVSWSPIESDSKFRADTIYTATITLTPTTGYSLNTIASNSFTLGSSTITHLANSGNLSAVFPAAPKDNVLFNSNGGTSVPSLPVDFAELIVKPEDPTRVGYTFSGWYDASNTLFDFDVRTMPSGDLTLTAQWTINQYSLNFESNQGTAVASIRQNYNSTVSAPTAPTRTGYTFDGWYRNAGLTTPYTFNTIPAEDVTLYAKWTINQYTLSFDSNQGTSVGSIRQDYNSVVSAPSAPSRTGYTFDGWYSNAGLTTPYSFTTMPANDVTLYAKWAINQYSIHFESNLGSPVASLRQDYNSAISAPSAPTRLGYSFGGWYAEDTLQTSYTFSTVSAQDVTLYAKWNINQYRLSFNTNEGSPVDPITQDFNSLLTRPVNPTRRGFVFDDWYETDDLSTPYAFTSMPANDVIVYAKWIRVADLNQNVAETILTDLVEREDDGELLDFFGYFSEDQKSSLNQTLVQDILKAGLSELSSTPLKSLFDEFTPDQKQGLTNDQAQDLIRVFVTANQPSSMLDVFADFTPAQRQHLDQTTINHVVEAAMNTNNHDTFITVYGQLQAPDQTANLPQSLIDSVFEAVNGSGDVENLTTFFNGLTTNQKGNLPNAVLEAMINKVLNEGSAADVVSIYNNLTPTQKTNLPNEASSQIVNLILQDGDGDAVKSIFNAYTPEQKANLPQEAINNLLSSLVLSGDQASILGLFDDFTLSQKSNLPQNLVNQLIDAGAKSLNGGAIKSLFDELSPTQKQGLPATQINGIFEKLISASQNTSILEVFDDLSTAQRTGLPQNTINRVVQSALDSSNNGLILNVFGNLNPSQKDNLLQIAIDAIVSASAKTSGLVLAEIFDGINPAQRSGLSQSVVNEVMTQTLTERNGNRTLSVFNRLSTQQRVALPQTLVNGVVSGSFSTSTTNVVNVFGGLTNTQRANLPQNSVNTILDRTLTTNSVATILNVFDRFTSSQKDNLPTPSINALVLSLNQVENVDLLNRVLRELNPTQRASLPMETVDEVIDTLLESNQTSMYRSMLMALSPEQRSAMNSDAAQQMLQVVRDQMVSYVAEEANNGIKVNDFKAVVKLNELFDPDVESVNLELVAELKANDNASGLKVNQSSLSSQGLALTQVFDINLIKTVYRSSGTSEILPVENADIVGMITIRLPIPQETSGEGLQVVFIDDEGEVEYMATQVVEVDGQRYLEFETDHFSYYGIVTAQTSQYWTWMLMALGILLILGVSFILIKSPHRIVKNLHLLIRV